MNWRREWWPKRSDNSASNPTLPPAAARGRWKQYRRCPVRWRRQLDGGSAALRFCSCLGGWSVRSAMAPGDFVRGGSVVSQSVAQAGSLCYAPAERENWPGSRCLSLWHKLAACATPQRSARTGLARAVSVCGTSWQLVLRPSGARELAWLALSQSVAQAGSLCYAPAQRENWPGSRCLSL